MRKDIHTLKHPVGGYIGGYIDIDRIHSEKNW